MEDLSVLEPSSVVPPGRVIPSGQVWGGSPAAFVRNLTKDEKMDVVGFAEREGLVADARPGLDPAECAAPAQLLTELVPLLAHRNGADPDAFAARLAALLAQGVAARP